MFSTTDSGLCEKLLSISDLTVEAQATAVTSQSDGSINGVHSIAQKGSHLGLKTSKFTVKKTKKKTSPLGEAVDRQRLVANADTTTYQDSALLITRSAKSVAK